MTRPEEIKTQYIRLIDRHLDDLVENRAIDMFEIEDFSRLLFIHPTHLSNTIRATTGTSACGIFQVKIMERSLRLLSDRSLRIRDIALQLTYEPSHFTKWFRQIATITPKEYRQQLSGTNAATVNSAIMTILKNYADLSLHF